MILGVGVGGGGTLLLYYHHHYVIRDHYSHMMQEVYI